MPGSLPPPESSAPNSPKKRRAASWSYYSDGDSDSNNNGDGDSDSNGNGDGDDNSNSDDSSRKRPLTQDIPPDLPIHSGQIPVFDHGLSSEDVTRMLWENEYSFQFNTVRGLARYDGTQLAAKSPCENRFVHGKFPSPFHDGSEWMAWGVFDGYRGWETADALEKYLITFIHRSLESIAQRSKPPFTKRSKNSLSDPTFRNVIKQAFLQLDRAITPTSMVFKGEEPLQDKLKQLAPCSSGSCALVSIYVPKTKRIHIACTSDSRAVFASRDRGIKIWTSNDQTCEKNSEVKKIQKNHPGEVDIIQDGLLFGRKITRSFGDAQLKWPTSLQNEVAINLLGNPPIVPSYNFLTPPYLRASPAVTNLVTTSGGPSFLIMATASFWRMVSTQDAIDIMRTWCDHYTTRTGDDGEPQKRLRVGQREEGKRTITTRDENAAVHLVRNALGGDNHAMVASQLASLPSFSAYVRDDITVQVIFFNLKLEAHFQKRYCNIHHSQDTRR
ncbi:phosphatase 2C-like domain-containing protein [Nemania sp. FL0031]|nr:phosphatase 2C-like domain-containing protein [Nemania sp. FL0031]